MAETIAVVTNADEGLGFSVVKGLCEKFNGLVYLATKDYRQGRVAVKKLEQLGYKPRLHDLDVSNEYSVIMFTDFVFLKEGFGGTDILVNNAAISEWDQMYPTYEAAKKTIDVNFKSLLTIEHYLYALLREGARVVNVSSACGHLSNLKNKKWLEILQDKDLTTEQVIHFVNEYLDSVKNGTFKKEDFADEGKHADHRVSQIAVAALTMIQQKKYYDKNISINVVHPGHVKTGMAQGGGGSDPDEAVKNILHLALDASSNFKGSFMWHDGKLVDWFDVDGDYYYKCKCN